MISISRQIQLQPVWFCVSHCGYMTQKKDIIINIYVPALADTPRRKPLQATNPVVDYVRGLVVRVVRPLC